jgi:MFS transporter, ACS family, hexuronate transporter
MDPVQPTSKSGTVTSQPQTGGSAVAERTPSRIPLLAGNFRWVICVLLLFGTTKNYMDRNVLGVLNVTLQHTFGWTEIDYSNLVVFFQAAYAGGMLLMGRLIDKLGTRLGYALAMVFWSLASMATAFGNSFTSFAISRIALGFGEAAVFPASIKAVAEWYPKKERALSTGIFNAGTSIGAMITPVVVPWIHARWGWRGAFIGIGALGFVWLLFWLILYRNPEEHPRVSRTELDYIRSDPPQSAQRMKWATLFRFRQTWAFVVGKFLTDPVWWFYLFWVPGFLQKQHALSLTGIGAPIVLIYLMSDVGSVVAGWLSSTMIKRGRAINASRKIAMLCCAVAVTPIVFAYRVESTWSAALLIGLAAACHQGFSANLYTITSDMFPAKAVSSVVGIGGMAGAIGGLFIATIVGHVLQWTGSYKVPFLIAGSAYLLALLLIHVLVPRLEPVTIPGES